MNQNMPTNMHPISAKSTYWKPGMKIIARPNRAGESTGIAYMPNDFQKYLSIADLLTDALADLGNGVTVPPSEDEEA
jgi:hypothetical protein